MAITERYVSATGAGTHDGTSEANAFSWTEMVTDINTPRVGFRYNVKGNVSPSATDTITGDGTQVSPNIIRGYKNTIGDLDNVGRTGLYGGLVTTDLPVIAYGATFRFNATGADYLILQNFVFTGNPSAALIVLGAQCVAYQIKATNSGTNAASTSLACSGAGCMFMRCDADCSGASTAPAAIDIGSSATDARIVNCRVVDTPKDAIRVAAASCVVANCVFGFDVDEYCIDYISGTTTACPPLVLNCTSYSGGLSFYRNGSTNYTKPASIINCHVTDNGGYLALSSFSGVSNVAIILSTNRTRDLASGVSLGFTNWVAATTWNHVTNAGTASDDYTDATTNDLSLKSSAVGRGVGILGNDIGAITKQAAATPYVIGG